MSWDFQVQFFEEKLGPLQDVQLVRTASRADEDVIVLFGYGMALSAGYPERHRINLEHRLGCDRILFVAVESRLQELRHDTGELSDFQADPDNPNGFLLPRFLFQDLEQAGDDGELMHGFGAGSY